VVYVCAAVLKKLVFEKGAPVVADVLAVILYLIFLPRLIAFFLNKSWRNGVLVTLVYLIFCASVVVFRKLPNPDDKKTVYRKGWLGFFGLTFGIFVTFMVAETAGLFEMLDNVSGAVESRTALAVLGGMILWLIMAFLYLIVLYVKVNPSQPKKTLSTWMIELFALLGVNAMILITVGFWHSYFYDIEPYDGLALGGKVLIFLLTYIFFMLFFAAPRMLFLLKKPSAIAIVTFIVQTGFYIWRLLSGTAWN